MKSALDPSFMYRPPVATITASGSHLENHSGVGFNPCSHAHAHFSAELALQTRLEVVPKDLRDPATPPRD